MLNQLRSLTKTWVAGVLVGVLVLSFAIWGVADIFTGRIADAVAVVGKEQISVNRFSLEFERELTRLQEESGQSFDRSTAVALGLDRAVLNRLALNAAFDQRAADLGLEASQRTLAREMAAIPAFADPFTGRFDADTYRMLLQQNNMTPQQFEGDLRRDVIQRQLQGALGSGVRAPDALGAMRLRYVRETRAVSSVVIPPQAAGDIAEPTPAELEAYYADVESSFAVPTMRAFTFVTITLDDFVPDVPVTDEELQEAYDARVTSLATAETRDIVEIAAPDEATAQQAAERLRAGEEPAAVAEALGLVEPTVHDDAVRADILTAALAEAAFSAAQGEVTDPVDGGIAWFVARVDAITETATQSLEDLRSELTLEIAQARAGDLLFDAIDAFELARGQGASIEDAAAAARLPSFSYGLVDSQGASLDGGRASVLSTYPDILGAAFGLAATGIDSELTPLGEDGYFVVRTDEIAPASVRPLADVEPQVRAQYALVKRSEALDALAEAARASLASGAAPADAAVAASPLATGAASEHQRAQAEGAISRELLTRLFAASPGDAIVAATPDGGRVVARVDSVRPADALPPEEMAGLRGVIEQELLADVEELYVRALQQAYSVRENPALIAQATGVGATGAASGFPQ